MEKLLKIGRCPKCEKEIMIFKKGRPRKSKDYDEFWISLSNGSRMRMLICKKCKPNLNKKDVDKIMKRCCATWERELLESDKMTLEEKARQIDIQTNLKASRFCNEEKDI